MRRTEPPPLLIRVLFALLGVHRQPQTTWWRSLYPGRPSVRKIRRISFRKLNLGEILIWIAAVLVASAFLMLLARNFLLIGIILTVVVALFLWRELQEPED